MSLLLRVALPIALAFINLPSAIAAPGDRVQEDFATGCDLTDYYPGFYCWEASSSKNPSGLVTGRVTVTICDGTMCHYIDCQGPAYAGVVSVSPGNGNTRVQAKLDPASSDCISFNVTTPLMLALSGVADGDNSSSENATSTLTYDHGATVYRTNTQTDCFSELITGSVGTFPSSTACSTSTIARSRIK